MPSKPATYLLRSSRFLWHRDASAREDTTVPTTLSEAKALSRRLIQVMADGSIEDFEAIVHRDAINREARTEPPPSRGRGPAAFHATALWLRDAYADLNWIVHDVIAEGDLASLHCTMSGRHVGTFCGYSEDGRVKRVFPPTRKWFATTQTHWFRIAEGKVIEHWANRDDLGTATQLGWTPRLPRYLLRIVRANRRARRAGGSSAGAARADSTVATARALEKNDINRGEPGSAKTLSSLS